VKETLTEREPIHPDEALALVLADVPEPALEILPLERLLGRALARELLVQTDQPPFDKASMDGYAYSPLLPSSEAWRLAEVIPAGAAWTRPLGPGECARIMTGAPIPVGACGVQRREYAEETDGWVRFTRTESGENIIRRGENQKAGEILMGPRRLGPQDIGVLASSGYCAVPVARRPLVGVVSTGDELAGCGEPLPEGAIYDSNGPQLAAQAHALGCDVRSYGIVPDAPDLLSTILLGAISECDVVIVSGAVSLGDYDFVPRAFAEAKVRTVFHGLKMRPGKPTFHGRSGTKSVFGLPGNPVSTFVNFEVIVRPHLLKRMGLADNPLILELPLRSPLARRGTDRVDYLPAMLESGIPGLGAGSGIRPLDRYSGSSMLSALTGADCLVRMDIGIESIPEGGLVHARLIRP